jgi:hypothetical protein
MNDNKLRQIINEELTKSQVESMINSKLESSYSSKDFKKAVKDLSGEVVNEIFKLLWQRNNFWKSSATRV